MVIGLIGHSWGQLDSSNHVCSHLASTDLVLPKARTNLYGIDTLRFVGQKLWQSVPKEIKESQSLDIFKRNIKAIPLDCSCKLCKSYIAKLSFL